MYNEIEEKAKKTAINLERVNQQIESLKELATIEEITKEVTETTKSPSFEVSPGKVKFVKNIREIEEPEIYEEPIKKGFVDYRRPMERIDLEAEPRKKRIEGKEYDEFEEFDAEGKKNE